MIQQTLNGKPYLGDGPSKMLEQRRVSRNVMKTAVDGKFPQLQNTGYSSSEAQQAYTLD